MRTIMGAVLMAVLMGCSRGPQPMNHLVVAFPDDGLEGALDAASQDGWEVESTRRTVTDGVGAYEVILKRPMSLADDSPHLQAFVKERQDKAAKVRAEFMASQEKDRVTAEHGEAERKAHEVWINEFVARQQPAEAATATPPAPFERGPDGKIRIKK